MNEKLLKRFVSAVSTFSLLVNSYIAPLAVLAQELSPTPEPTPIVEETTSSTTVQTQIPEETISPTIEPTQTPEETVLPTEASAEVKTEQTEEPTQSNESVDSSPTAISSTTPEVEVVTTENTELNVNLLENTSSTSINEFDFSIQQDGSATLITDKADYAPTDTALITGLGFIPNKEYTIEITSTTGNFIFSDKVTSDESGGLFYTYQLDGTYRPDYKVEVKDGNILVSTVTFTDSYVVGNFLCENDFQGANDEPGQKDLTKMCIDTTLVDPLVINWNWDEKSPGGNVGGNTGDACSLFDTDGDGFTNYSMCVIVDGDPSQYVKKVLYSCGDTKTDRCTNPVEILSSLVTPICSAEVKDTDPFSNGTNKPYDTVASCDINLSDVGDPSSTTLLDVCSYPSQQPNSDPSDCIVALTDNDSGTIEIIKDLIPSDDNGRFNLQIDGENILQNIGDGSTTGPIEISTGAHTVGEVAYVGTILADYTSTISCADSQGSVSGSGPLEVDLSKNENIVCTITNTKNQGTLRVVKTVVNDNGGTKTPSNFSFQVNGGSSTAFEADGTNDLTVTPGNYSVTEPSVTGYATTYDNCTNINVVSDQTATCTITNNDIQPKLTVTKIVDGGDMQISDFSLFVGTTGVTSGVQNGFNVGNYTVSETNKSGYTSAITGDCLANGSISLVLGDVKSCTITNTRDTGSITIDKVTLPANDITDFNFNILSTDTGVDQDLNLEDQDTPFTSIFDTGIYTIEEKSIPTGWSLSSLACDQSATINLNSNKVTFDLDKGEDIKCTFTNTKLPTLTVNKILSPVGHGGFDLMIDGVVKASNVGDGGTTGANIVTIGNHIISETNGNPSTVIGDYIVEFGGDCDVDGKITLAAGENGVCTITNTAYGSLTIIKDSIPNDAQDFSFTTTGTGLSGFNLDDDSDSTLSNTKIFLHVTPGLYSVSETDITGWDLTSATCSDGSTLDSINIAAGENVTCTFTNTKLSKIIIEKQTLPNGSLESFDFVSDYDVNGFSLTDGQQNDSGYLLSGIYSVDENTPSGWDMGYSCSDGSTKNSINLQAGEIVTCTFTNTQRGSIYGYKYEDSDGSNSTTTDRTAVAGWTIELWEGLVKVGEAVTGTDGKFTFSDLIFGNYKLIEQTISGWFNVTNDNLSVTLVPGEDDGPNNFVNFEKAKIIVHKNVFGPFGSDVTDLTSFSVFLDGKDERSVAEGTITTYLDLEPGTYTISEGTPPSGYKLDSMTDDGVVTVTSGGEFHIYIINSQLPGSITIVKDALPSAAFNFRFTGDLGSFTLDDDNADLTYSNTTTFSNLGAGTYSVTENPYTTWTLTNLVCVDPDQSTVVDIDSRNATIDLDFGENITCTFTNSRRPKINIIKHVINDNGGTNVAGDFTVNVDGENPSKTTLLGSESGTWVYFDPGSYSIDEIEQTGYTKSLSANCSGTLSYGNSRTCTITNNDQSGTLIIKKVVENNYGGLLQADDFGFKVNGEKAVPFEVDGQNDLIVDAGTYTIVEPTVSGYSTSYDNCTDVVISNGGSQTCTITNSDIQPKLTVTKVVVNDNGGTKDVSDFPLFVDTTGVISEIENGFNVGNYVVSETSQDGYVGTIGGDCDEDGNVSLAPGDDKTCTITNDDLPGHLIVYKETNPINNSTGFVILLEGGNLVSGRARRDLSVLAPVDYEVNAGTFSVSENSLSGWDETINTCSDIVVGVGETKECTITNTKLSSIQGKKFEDINGDGDKDSNDTFLNGWTINLYKQGEGWEFVEPKITGHTGTLGQYRFDNLMPDRYLVCEELKDNWMQTAPISGIGYDDGVCFEIDLSAGQNLQGYQFGNFEKGKIQGMKYEDSDGDRLSHETGESYLNDWDIRLYKSWEEPVTVTTSNTGNTGQYLYEDLLPGTYYVCEVKQPDWAQTWPSVGDYPISDSGVTRSEYGVAVDNLSGAEDEYPVCWQTEINSSGDFNQLLRFGNARLASIHGYKWDDINGDGERCTTNLFTRGLIDTEFGCEELLSDWTIELYKITNTGDGESREFVDSMETDSGEKHFGWYWFENLLPGTYEVCEVNKPGWEQTYPGSCHRVTLPDDNSGGMAVGLNAVSGPEYNFGNYLKDPKIEITKSNNKNNAQREDIVTYTLTLTNSGNVDLNNVKVIDALPGGFSYIAGTSMLDGVSISDPTISGNTLEWNIGSIEKDGIRVIIYDVKISDSVIDGTYKNLATCSAEVDKIQVVFFALFVATDQVEEDVETIEGNVTDSAVNIGLDQSYGGNLNGQVLGASTELPDTGSPTWVLIFAVSGLIVGLFLKKKYAKN